MDMVVTYSPLNSSGLLNETYNESVYEDFNYGYAKFYLYLWTVVTPIIFTIIIIIGTFGNFMVIYVILSRPKMRTTTNILLLNLAIADIAFLLTCVPFQALKYALFEWRYGEWVCKLMQFSLYVTAYVTIWTLTVIAFMRYITVVWSTQTARYRTKNNVTMLSIFIWIIVMIVNISSLIGHQVNKKESYSYCGMNPDWTEGLILSFFICAYALPLFLICVSYLLILCHLQANRASMLAATANSKRRARASRACRTIVIVVIVFCISWLPNNIISLQLLYGELPKSDAFQVFRIIANCMAYGNSLANPFIYHYVSEEFRTAFTDVCSSKCCNGEHHSRLSLRSFRTTTYRMSEIDDD